MQFNSKTYTFSDRGRFGQIVLIIGMIGLIASVIGMFLDRDQFFQSWLTSFTYWVSIGFGALLFVMLHHMVGAVWSIVIRRLMEAVMMALPYMIIFAIPVLIGIPSLYEWANLDSHGDEHTQVVAHTEEHGETEPHAETVLHEEDHHGEAVTEEHHSEMEHDESGIHGENHHAHQAHVDLIRSKQGYLNTPFFIIRTIVYFAVWTLLALLLWRTSIGQDFNGYDPAQQTSFRKISAPGIIVYALTVTFAGFDWLMSLMPAWYSTIYGLYYFAGGLMSIMAFTAVVTVTLNRNKVLDTVISKEHYHDIGKLLFAFMIVWAYFAFSQYLLIWYANIPEETIYYRDRWVGSWKIVSVLIPIAHFVIPFILVMSRHIKRNPKLLRFWAIWLLVMHWVDLYWNVMPVFHATSAMPSWMDLATMMGIGGFFLFFFWKNFTQHPAVPVHDPRLQESITFRQ